MKKLIILFTIFLALACSEGKTTYFYLEMVKTDIDIKLKDPKIIEATSDSIAYFQAYREFTVSKNVSRDIRETLSHGYMIGKPIRFYVVSNDGKFIQNIGFVNKYSLEKEIEKEYEDINIKDALEKAKK